MKHTIESVRNMVPCPDYQDDDYALLKQLFDGRESISDEEVLELNISDDDKAWFFCQPNVMHVDDRNTFIKKAAERSLKHAAAARADVAAHAHAARAAASADYAANATARANAHATAACAAYAASAARAAASAASAARVASAASAADKERATQVSDIKELIAKRKGTT